MKFLVGLIENNQGQRRDAGGEQLRVPHFPPIN